MYVAWGTPGSRQGTNQGANQANQHSPPVYMLCPLALKRRMEQQANQLATHCLDARIANGTMLYNKLMIALSNHIDS